MIGDAGTGYTTCDCVVYMYFAFFFLKLFNQKQSKLLWKVRDDLQKNCSLPELREMLEDNGLNSQGGESSVSEQHIELPG